MGALQNPADPEGASEGEVFRPKRNLVLFLLQVVPSYGTQAPHSNSHSVHIPMTEIHVHPGSVFDTGGDPTGQRQAHTVYYNICQV